MIQSQRRPWVDDPRLLNFWDYPRFVDDCFVTSYAAKKDLGRVNGGDGDGEGDAEGFNVEVLVEELHRRRLEIEERCWT